MQESFGNPHSHQIGFNRESDPTSTNFFEMRGRNILKKLIHSNPADAPQLEQAHNVLVTDPNYASAMHAAASALQEEQIHVFISYRMKTDSDLAKTVTQALDDLSGGKVKVTSSDEFDRDIPGKNYRDAISTAIPRTHWFVLLMSDPTRHNDWCMFETGMFYASIISAGINRLICIHHPDTAPPSPIEGLHAVEATLETLEAFFDGLIRKDQPLPGWEALNPDADDESLRHYAETITRQIKGPSTSVVFNYGVTIDVKQPSSIDSADALTGCRISADPKTADLFGKMTPPDTWGDLIENVKSGGRQDQWLTELAAIIKRSCSNNKFRPISGTFECDQGGRMLRPVLESIIHDGVDRVYRVRLIFIEDHCTVPAQEVPARVLAFLNAHRVNSRLRWELVERFVNADWDNGQIDACHNVLSRIERDGQSFSQWDLDTLCENYPASAQVEIRRIVERWRELRRTGANVSEVGRGELDLAIDNHDVGRVRELVYECAALVSDFLRTSDPVMQQLTNAR